jgi:hypothetical protein
MTRVDSGAMGWTSMRSDVEMREAAVLNTTPAAPGERAQIIYAIHGGPNARLLLSKH